MITNIFDKDCAKILTVVSLSPGSKFMRKELQEKTSLYNVPLDSSLQKLTNASILLKSGKYYVLEHERSKDVIKIISNEYKRFRELPLATYFAIIDIAYILSGIDVELILFGSYSKLTYNVNSDIDIALISDKKVHIIERRVSRIERIHGKNIQLHHFNKQEFYKNQKDALIKSIIRDGIKI